MWQINIDEEGKGVNLQILGSYDTSFQGYKGLIHILRFSIELQ